MTAISEARHADLTDLDPAVQVAWIRDLANRALEHVTPLEQCPVTDAKSIDAVSHLGPLFRAAVSLCNQIAPEVENE